MNLQQRAIRGFGWMLSGTGAQAVLRIVFWLVLARMLGPHAVGVAAAALLVFHFATIFANLGIPAAVAQRSELTPRHVDAAFYLALASGLLASAAVFLAAPLIERFFGFYDLAGMTRLLAIAPFIAAFGIVPDGLLRRELRFRAVAMSGVVGTAGFGIIGIAMALGGYGPSALVLACLAEQALRTMVLLHARPHTLEGGPERAALRDIAVFATGITLRRLGHNTAEGVDNLVVGRMLGAEALGLYGRAYQIVSVAPATLGRAMGHVMMPVMAKVQSDPARLAAAYLRSTAVLAKAGLPAATTVGVLAPQIIEVMLGREWLSAAVPLRILAFGIFLRLMLQLAEALGTAAGSVYAVAWRQGVYAGAVCGGALAGAPFGLPGVAYGVLAAQVFAYLLTTQLCLRITSLEWWQWIDAHWTGGALACGVLAATTACVVVLSGQPAILILACGLATASLVCLPSIATDLRTLLARPRSAAKA